MRHLNNPHRGIADALPELVDIPFPSNQASAPSALLEKCPAHGKTPLVGSVPLAEALGLNTVWLKDETGRMGLGSFKALGAAYVIAHMADQLSPNDPANSLSDKGFVTASAGNHGLSVAAGAKVFGARAVIYLARTVPAAFAERLREKGAEVRIEGDDYQASMDAAQLAAEREGLTLLSDSSWPGYLELPHRLMEGYLVMAAEIIEQVDEPPTHVFLQAGVGGLAGGVATLFRQAWGEGPMIIVVEPEAAPALIESIAAGKPVDTSGPDSNMGRLDCKTPSLIALKGLARDADRFCTITDEEAVEAVRLLENHGVETTPSGAAGFAAMMVPELRSALALDKSSRALAIVSEGTDQ